MKLTQKHTLLASAALVLGSMLPQACTAQSYGYNNGYGNDGYSNGYNNGYYNNNQNASLETFYRELAPYGTWINDPDYGYVWRPDVGQQDFRPYYTNGRWAMTDYGNTWVSNYSWGWAPFHYGRWALGRYNQWVWIPGTEWAPAWVDWRYGDDFYGWAPMGPSLSVSVGFGRGYSLPLMAWTFVSGRNLYNTWNSPYRYDNRYIYNRTTIINNYYGNGYSRYNRGPGLSSVRRYYNNVPIYSLDHSGYRNRSGIYGNTVSIYRPRTIQEGARPASGSGSNWNNGNDTRDTRWNGEAARANRGDRPTGVNSNPNWSFGDNSRSRTPENRPATPVNPNNEGNNGWSNTRGGRGVAMPDAQRQAPQQSSGRSVWDNARPSREAVEQQRTMETRREAPVRMEAPRRSEPVYRPSEPVYRAPSGNSNGNSGYSGRSGRR